MRKIALLLVVVLLSFGAYTASIVWFPEPVLDYSDSSARFADAPFSEDETVAISLLTNLRAVSGYPDQSFRPGRRVTRAEFLKIAIASHPKTSELVWGPITCFPDVSASDWFSPYVCAAKEHGIVRGYPDGTFQPGKVVNYVEAVKMLVELYRGQEGKVGQVGKEGEWYETYMKAAGQKGVLLSEEVPYDRFLTRGEVARLAAAFRAEHEGELEMYRWLEIGKDRSTFHVPRSTFEEPSQSASSSVSSNQRATSNEPIRSGSLKFPSRSRFLLLGERTPPLADGVFQFGGEDALVRIVEVKLDKEVKSFKDLVIIDSEGREFASWPLRLYPLDPYNRTWRWEYEPENSYRLPADTDVHLAVIANLWERGNRGISDELVEIRSFTLMTQGVKSNVTQQLFPASFTKPFHQTVQSSLIDVLAVSAGDGRLMEGKKRSIGSFSFRARTPPETAVTIEQLSFQVDQSGVSVTNWELGKDGDDRRVPCFTETLEEDVIVCPNLPEPFVAREGEDISLTLFGTISFNAAPPRHLQVSLEGAGSVVDAGSVWWSDGTGHFVWMESEEPVAVGTRWE